MSEERVKAVYLAETPYSLEKAAQIIAGEQSTGTFTAVPGETDTLKERHAARVEAIEALEEAEAPSLPGAKLPQGHDGKYRRGYVTVSFPLHNFGPSIPNLMSAVAGNLYELRELSGLRLVDLELPASFAKRYPGPKFGIEGTRRLTGVYGRPILGTIVKPSVGLSPEELGKLVYELALAGMDFIKDDELNADPPYFPLELKVKTVMEAVERAADVTGRKLMYAFNITGDIDELKANHDLVVRAGGTCVMVSILSVGLAGLAYLNGYSEVPIHGHRNQWGMLTRAPLLGFEFAAYQKLCRLAGADQLHVNGLNSKFYESNESVLRSIKACTTPLFGGYEAMPVVSSAQWAGTAPATYEATGSVDVMHLAGGGMLAHPDGPAAGFESMKLGWEAAVQGIPLDRYALEHPILQRAIDKYGKG
ncbi:ribulose 1,5-bisphosphate carboxylase [Cohnella sp. CIP 111063]|uniref:ribulose-bisphosphate carboxylase large subunit family protein n=1 Tax=unclassified Cohnella TaxID=2636738 RepID=UPI000B8C65D7|nr:MULTISPECIES: ribulose-bisphosphate carboxylase large subunit family protein [unclassified Cohnella]OXS58326.1 ribulose 1,5-bisphosphate carboxylase [Cohnella sp. CIP 111063]PRX71608.1 ribulose-bisphosphate carboxylase large chain [Cohnella sp. SGD-V74]